ncbi:MAG: ubiquitin-conjugating enzyme E2 [Candidatus Nanoarchaeia archaeon]|nr:ubiquitin-conjugating enzyme E2 [Candidatus Nanoarchaeia archaeon]
MGINPDLKARLSRESIAIQEEGIPLRPITPLHWVGLIRYRGHVVPKQDYRFTIEIPKAYPYLPPTVTWKTPVIHPNIFISGYVCINILKDSWRPSYSLITVYKSLAWLLDNPSND